MIVYAHQLIEAAQEMRSDGRELVTLNDGMEVSPEQLQKAGELLRDGPQPMVNGVTSDMPGFFREENQDRADVLVLDIGILSCIGPYKIARNGTLVEDAEAVASTTGDENER